MLKLREELLAVEEDRMRGVKAILQWIAGRITDGLYGNNEIVK